MILVRVCVVLAVLFGAAGSAFAAERLALVIGNSDYRHVAALPNPRNDANDLSAVLSRLGFQVTTALDLSYNDMRRALGNFNAEATGAEMAIVFYAGHGMEIGKQNYLIPVDAELKRDSSVPYEAIPLDLVTDAVSGSKGLKLVILDACRDNPFAAAMTMTNASRSIGRGLARLEPTPGTLVAYAAKEGTVAADGQGRNSPYTKALIDHLEEPGLEINFLFRRVRDAVLRETANRQQPFTYGSLPAEEIYLKGAPALQSSALPSVPTAPSGQTDKELELTLWKEVSQLNDPDMLRLYLDTYPNGIFAAVARLRIAVLERAPEAPAPAPQTDDNGTSRQQVAAVEPNEPAIPEPAADPGEGPGVRVVTACDRLAADGDDPGALAPAVDFSSLSGNASEAVRTCEAALDAHADDARLQFQLGRSLEAAGRTADAAAIYVVAADKGFAPAQYRLGDLHYYGNGIEQDYTKTAYWYRLAAEQGHSVAQSDLGWLYEKGYGVEQDYAGAREWYSRAAGRGNLLASRNVGQLYYYGRGVERDYVEAMRWYRPAAEQGHATAQYDMGWMYHHGEGVEKDYERAFEWYRKSAEQGNDNAQEKLGDLYYFGNGVAKDLTKSVLWYRKAAEQGNAAAQYDLGWAYEHGDGIAQNYGEAAAWYRKAADQDESSAMYSLAKLYDTGTGVERDPREGARLLLAAAKSGEDKAKEQLEASGDQFSRALRQEVQRILRDEGNYSGALDGVFGPASRRAVRSYIGE